MPYKRYLQILHLCDKVIFDDFSSLTFDDNYKEFDSIEQICYYFMRTRKMTELNDDNLFLLNSLPEHYIKPLIKFIQPLSDKLIRYLYIDDISLINTLRLFIENRQQNQIFAATKKIIILLGILHAMKYLHYKGVIHRDLKPCIIFEHPKKAEDQIDFDHLLE